MGLIDQMMANIYKPQKQEKSAPHLPKNLTPAKVAAMTTQTTVTQGQLLRGEVMDLRANQIMVLLENGATVTARTDGTLELSIGQNAQFLVAQTTEDQILLRHVKEQTTTENPMVEKALTAAGITKTDRSISIVTELLAHQQPVNEGTIRHYLSLSGKYPEFPVKDLILMELHHIPVTKEFTEQFASYQSQTGKLLTQAQEMIKSLANQVQTLPEGEQKQAFLHELRTILSTPENTPVLPSERITLTASAPAAPQNHPEAMVPKDSPETVVSQNTADAAAPQNVQTPDIVPDIPRSAMPQDTPGTATPVLTQESLLQAKPDSSSSIQKFSDRAPLDSLLNEFMETFLLKPEDIDDGEKIKKYYNKLDEKLEQLEQLSLRLSETTKETSDTTPKQMRSNLSFMEAVNQVFPYIQLPLKFRESPAHGELYVYEKKRSLKPSDALSALLHLELDYLGTTDIFVTLSGTHVTTRFSMTNKEAGELIRTELPSLRDALLAKGYTLQSEVTVHEPDTAETTPTLLEQFLEEHAPGGLNRYTFDIRA